MGRVGAVTVGKEPAFCPPWPPTEPPALCRKHSNLPRVPGWCWHRAPWQHLLGEGLALWSQQSEQHRRVVAHQKVRRSSRRMVMVKGEGSGLTFNAVQGPRCLCPWQNLGMRSQSSLALSGAPHPRQGPGAATAGQGTGTAMGVQQWLWGVTWWLRGHCHPRPCQAAHCGGSAPAGCSRSAAARDSSHNGRCG